jgi:hypothetical protein
MAIIRPERTLGLSGTLLDLCHLIEHDPPLATLLDLLQLACGMLVVTQFDGKVTPALQDWGFNIIQTSGRTPEPPEPTAPTT